jgi:hypothetical protein
VPSLLNNNSVLTNNTFTRISNGTFEGAFSLQTLFVIGIDDVRMSCHRFLDENAHLTHLEPRAFHNLTLLSRLYAHNLSAHTV